MGSVGANKDFAALVRKASNTELENFIRVNNSVESTGARTAALEELNRRQSDTNALKRIAQAKFTEEGNGNWQMDIPDIGGGVVLDETGSTRAYREGFMPNAKVYSASAWTYDENGTPTVTDLGTFNRRNQAQSAIRDTLRGNRRVRLENRE